MREILPQHTDGEEGDALERAIESFLAGTTGADGVGGKDDLSAPNSVGGAGG